MPATRKPQTPALQLEYDAEIGRACKQVEALAKVVVGMPVKASAESMARLQLLQALVADVVDTLENWT